MIGSHNSLDIERDPNEERNRRLAKCYQLILSWSTKENNTNPISSEKILGTDSDEKTDDIRMQKPTPTSNNSETEVYHD